MHLLITYNICTIAQINQSWSMYDGNGIMENWHFDRWKFGQLQLFMDTPSLLAAWM